MGAGNGQSEEDLEKDFRFITANKFAEMDSQYQSTLFCLYGIDGRNRDAVTRACVGLAKGGSLYPIALHIIDLEDFKIPHLNVVRVSGEMTYATELVERVLHDGPYLCISSPITHVNSGQTRWLEAREAVSRAVGFITSVVGRGSIFGLALELEVPAGSELRQSVFTPGLRTPQPMEFVMLADVRPVEEIAASLTSAKEELRRRLEYAASLVGRASQEKDKTFRFILYWMALEVVVDGKERKVTDHLAQAYGKPFAIVRDGLELSVCLQMRYEIVHLGKTHSLDARTERLLQGYFLDLMRFELGLPCRYLAGSLLAVEATIQEAERTEERPKS